MKAPHLWTTAGTAALCCASISNADIITVTIEGYMQNIDDPTNYFMGGERWSASIDINTDTTMTYDQSSGPDANSTEYTGSATYSIGNRPSVAVDTVLTVVDSIAGFPGGFSLDILRIEVSGIGLSGRGFAAYDFDANIFDSTNLPPLGLTFDDGFNTLIGEEFEDPQTGAFAEVVTDTVTVTPTPSTTAMLALVGLAASRRRR